MEEITTSMSSQQLIHGIKLLLRYIIQIITSKHKNFQQVRLTLLSLKVEPCAKTTQALLQTQKCFNLAYKCIQDIVTRKFGQTFKTPSTLMEEFMNFISNKMEASC